MTESASRSLLPVSATKKEATDENGEDHAYKMQIQRHLFQSFKQETNERIALQPQSLHHGLIN